MPQLPPPGPFPSNARLVRLAPGSPQALSGTHLRMGEGVAGRVALTRQPAGIRCLADYPGLYARQDLLAADKFVRVRSASSQPRGGLEGVLEVFLRAPLELEPDQWAFLEAVGVQAAIAIDNARLFDDLQRSNVELTIAYDATIEGWSRAVDLRDHDTEGHSQRVTELTLRLARALDISGDSLVHIRRGALLHDLGKVGVPDKRPAQAGAPERRRVGRDAPPPRVRL